MSDESAIPVPANKWLNYTLGFLEGEKAVCRISDALASAAEEMWGILEGVPDDIKEKVVRRMFLEAAEEAVSIMTRGGVAP